MKTTYIPVLMLFFGLYTAYTSAFPTSCSAALGCDACIETQCLNGHRFTTLGNHTDPVGNNLWSDKVCTDAYGIAANWQFSPLSPGISQPWRTIWGTACPTYRTYTNKTQYEVLIQFLNISSAVKNPDGTYTVNAKVAIDGGGIHGLDQYAPIMILRPGQSQKVNYAHADILHTMLIVKNKESCIKAGKCASCTMCLIDTWDVASETIKNNLNFTIIMPTPVNVAIVADADQEPKL